MKRSSSVWRGVLAAALISNSAFAVDDASRAAARRMATTGVEAFQREDYATAVEKLEHAYEVLQAPSIGLWLARALVKQGRLVAASERYVEVGRLSVAQGEKSVQEAAKKDAATELEALLPRIPNLVVNLEGATAQEVTLTLDGAAMTSAFIGEERPIDPGKHHLEGHRGQQVVTEELSISAGEKRSLVLRFSGKTDAVAAPSPAAVQPAPVHHAETTASGGSSRRLLAWTTIGVGAAGLITGAVAGGLAIGKKGDLDDSTDCQNHSCLRSTMQSDLDSYSTLRTVSSIGFIAGGVLGAAGIVLLVTDDSSAETRAQRGVRLGIGASHLWAEGRF